MIKKNKGFIITTITLLTTLVLIIVCVSCSKKKSEKPQSDTSISDLSSIHQDTSKITEATKEESSSESTTIEQNHDLTTTKKSDKQATTNQYGNQTTTQKPSKAEITTEEYAYAYAGFSPVMANLDIDDWNLLLVNRDYILPDGYTPKLSEAVKGSGIKLDSRVAPFYQEMYNDAKADGITLTPVSGYRSISRQKTNFENRIQRYVNQGYSKAEATQMAAQVILPPGTSEHNAGLAMDIISLETNFEETKAFKWLCENAHNYGFILRYPKDKTHITKITYEPWHWRYVGVEHAYVIKTSGKCLEEYLVIS